MRIEEIIAIVDRIIAIKVDKDPTAPSISENEIEKK